MQMLQLLMMYTSAFSQNKLISSVHSFLFFKDKITNKVPSKKRFLKQLHFLQCLIKTGQEKKNS